MRPFILLVTLCLLVTAGACSQGDKDSFRNVDHDNNGKISYEELLFVFPDTTREAFRNLDTDGDNGLSKKEYANFLKQEALKASAAKAAAKATAAQTQTRGGSSVTAPTQPAVPYKGEEVIDIPAPATTTGRPTTQGKPERGAKSRKAQPATANTGQATQYTVMHGDNLTKIAHHFGVPVDAIVQANGNMPPDTLRDGQVLNIPARP